MKTSTYRGRRSAFTLIELSVVITIIAILSAILYPVVATVRTKSRTEACMSNFRQLGLGILAYAKDYDDTYPNGTYEYSAIGGWAGQVYPYVKNSSAFRCPDDSLTVSPTDNPTSYAMNSNYGVQGDLKHGVPNVAFGIKDLSAPKGTVLLFEVQGNNAIDVTTLTEGPYPHNYSSSPFGNGEISGFSPSGGGTFDSCSGDRSKASLKFATGYLGGRNPGAYACHYTGRTGRHHDGSNFLLGDGHARWFRGSDVSSGKNANSPADF